ncbi:DMT family transporter [Acetobacter sp. DsW_063]|uniref:DMT family transporter n=1 Tax=Acetobacter sp. DsW_063 TaxID=1514894 RepID=UPI000B746CE9|nr:DMT family transporter [Acetobacter sp. DsW_063]OUJ13133.1 membrane protein [Acetobacter sp. DsW_063]
MTALLFAAVVIVWGLSWFAIHLQVGGTTSDVAIFWRFAISSGLLGCWLAATQKLRPPPRALVPWLALLGMSLFSVNFLGIYSAASILPSGVVSVIFSTSTILNAANLWIFFRQRPDIRVVAGGVLGVTGVALLLSSGAGATAVTREQLLSGVALALVGTTIFSLGNMITRRIARSGFGLTNAVFYGMTFGSLLLACDVLSSGHSLAFPLTARWIGGLAYLSVAASVAGFIAYMSLIHRIGADRAAYTTIISPVIALGVSGFFEDLHWTTAMLCGVALVLSGNILAFLPRRGAPAVIAPIEVEQG